MKVGIIGSGGREHALCMSLKNSSIIEKIYCIPGNGGTYELAKNIFKHTNFKIAFLSGKTDSKKRKKILEELKKGNIDVIIGTHALFQKKIEFKKLGLTIIDEQHKFGVKQRSDLAKKGGNDCDVLLMSATPIPRTMMMSLYGDMDEETKCS